jgi:hypothetical protein
MPHAELPAAERDRLLSVFVEAFNACHGSEFEFSRETPQSDPSCDYLFVSVDSPDELLKVQLTRAGGDVETERRQPALIERFLAARIRELLRQHFPNDMWVSVSFDGSVLSKEEIAELALAIEDLVSTYARRSGRPAGPGRVLGAYDRDAEKEALPVIRRFCQSVEVRHVDDLGPSVLAWMRTMPDGRIVRPANRVAAAVEAKRDRLGPSARDLVLLAWLDGFPYDPAIDIAEIRRAVGASAAVFREVWVENLWADGRGQAHRVYPEGPIS